MKRLIVFLMFALSAWQADAAEHDWNRDLWCNITDIRGNALTYSFGPNTRDNPNAGTFAETSFQKNGQTTFSAPGTRPTWTWAITPRGIGVVQNTDISWGLHIDDNGAATLLHRTQEVGWGECHFPVRPTGNTAQNAVPGDMGL